MSLAFILLIAVCTGFFAGTLHVLSGPDHLAAIAPLTAEGHKKSWKTGMWWGIGHTSSFWFIAILVFCLKGFIPAVADRLGERIVGIVLVIVGMYGLQKVFQMKIHFHRDGSGGYRFFHVHKKDIHPHQHPHRRRGRGPMGIGIVHGFAGSTHLLAIIPALAIPGRFNAVAYVAGFGIGTVAAMTCFAWIMGLLHKRISGRFTNGYQWMQAGFSGMAIIVGIFWFITN